MDVSPKVSSPRAARSGIHYLLLLLITLLGGVLRFACLDRPGIWGDEALTFNRVYGSFDELLSRLADAGFAPLHYELLWLIGQHFKLTPFVMRLIPALSGTFMIPAMYWLSRELLGRQRQSRNISLLVALLTATNAFLLNYSRDAKMYSPFWLFAAINVASLLWWLHCRGGVAFWVWVSSGAAMLGFDALGVITLVIEFLMVLTTSRPRWRSLAKAGFSILSAGVVWLLTVGPIGLFILWRGGDFTPALRPWIITLIIFGVGNWLRLAIHKLLRPTRFVTSERKSVRPIAGWLNSHFAYPPLLLFVIGLVLISIGPVGYYLEFNRYLTRVDDRGWAATGLTWIGRNNRGRTAPELLGSTASSFLTAWEWPRASELKLVSIRTYRLLSSSVIAMAILLLTGLLPWHRRREGPATIGRLRHTTGAFRSAFWMTAWITLPLYGFYCVSFPASRFGSPAQWLQSGREFFGEHHWLWGVLSLFVGAWLWLSAGLWRSRLIIAVRAVAVGVAVFGLTQLIHHEYPALDAWLAKNSVGWRTHDSVWVPRYLAVALPPVLIIVSTLLWRLPTKTLRAAAITFFVVVNLSQHAARVFAGSEPPTQLLAQDLVDSRIGHVQDGYEKKGIPTRSYYTLAVQNGNGWDPGTGGIYSPVFRYYLAQESSELSDLTQWRRLVNNYRTLPTSWLGVDFERFIVDDIHRSPALQRLVTWQRLQSGEIDLSNRLLDLLEPDWRLESEQDFVARDHWRWVDLTVYRRRVYRKNSSDNRPAQPATTQHH